MKEGLTPGLTYNHRFVVTEAKTVPQLFPESAIFAAMPRVLATGFLVGLAEWACAELLQPHLDPGEGSLGTRIDLTHSAPTPVGTEVHVEARLEKVDGRRLEFSIIAHDESDEIGRGRHERVVVGWERFNARLAQKRKQPSS